MSGVRVQLPKNSHSRSITGIGTPISQSKSPFPIAVSLNVIYIKENVNCARSFPPATGPNSKGSTRSCGDVSLQSHESAIRHSSAALNLLTNDRCLASSSTVRPTGEHRPFATARSSAGLGSGRTPSGHRGAGD